RISLLRIHCAHCGCRKLVKPQRTERHAARAFGSVRALAFTFPSGKKTLLSPRRPLFRQHSTDIIDLGRQLPTFVSRRRINPFGSTQRMSDLPPTTDESLAG